MKNKYNSYGNTMAVEYLPAIAIGVLPLKGTAREKDFRRFALADCMKVKTESGKILVESVLWEVVDSTFAR